MHNMRTRIGESHISSIDEKVTCQVVARYPLGAFIILRKYPPFYVICAAVNTTQTQQQFKEKV